MSTEERLDPYPHPPGEDALVRAAGRLQITFDEEHGGFGRGPKLPRPQVLDFLVRAGARGFGRAKAMAERTLRAMALGGVYDQVGGGFHRRATDRAWRVPDFEKTLHGNAQLARAYTHAWQAWHLPLHRRVAEETLDYMVRDLATGAGAFAAGEKGGPEGAFYVWSHEEVAALAPEAVSLFGVQAGSASNVLVASGEDVPAAIRQKLRDARAGRPRPPRDDTALAAGNGLAIGALTEGGAAFGRPDLVDAARRAAAQVAPPLLADEAGAERGSAPGTLEDHAYLAEGLLTLWEVTFDRTFLDQAASLTERMVAIFWNEEEGAFLAGDVDPSGQSAPIPGPVLEEETPSPNAVAALALLRLAALLDRPDHEARAVRVLRVAAPYLEASPEETASFFAAVDLLALGPKKVAFVGDPADPGFSELVAQAWTRLVPNRVLSGGAPGSGAPFTEGRDTIDGRPTAYVWEGKAPLPPTSDPAELGRQLRPWKTPTDEEVRRIVRRMEGAVQYRHLFDQLQNPRWMEPLRDRGFFTKPPEPVLDYTRGTIGSPPWPESGYLARAAAAEPATAHAIGLDIPDTANAQVHEDIADLALALPAPLAASFVPRLAAWAGQPYHLLLADKLGRLLVHLASGGAVDAALRLGRSMLELVPDPMQGVPGEDRFRPNPEPRPKFEEFEYAQILREHIPELVAAAGPPALVLLCEALEDAIALSALPGEDAPPADHSYIWRPAIEEEPPSEQAPRDALLTAVRDAAVSIARRGPDLLAEVLEVLRARTRHVFRRVALHVLWEIEDSPIELVRAALADRGTLENPHFHHEYLLLAAERLLDLPEEERETILGWVAEGPQDAASLATQDEAGRKRWTQDRLALLLDVVSEPWQRWYEELTDELGPPEHPEFAAPPGLGRRRNSPRSADDLRRMGPGAVLELLRTWEPPGGWARPSRDGLAYELMLTVAADPEPYAKAAARFAVLDRAYIEALLFGLRQAITRELPFPWQPVIDLCRRVLDSEPGTTVATPGSGVSPVSADDPGGVRREMAHLLSAGFATGPASIPFELRTEVWSVLGRLTSDPDPDPEQESKLLKAGVELATISTNTTRGKALHATVRYALWVRRHIENAPGSVQRMMAGFDEMPEAREVLDAHLDPRRDPSSGVRVVYGWWLPWLVMLDPEWTRRRLGDILPRDRALDDLRHAAWGAYLTFNTPYENVWNLLKGEYRRAAERLSPRSASELHLPGPEERLAEHLLSVYWRGKLRLEDSDSALSRLFARAPDALAAHAITFAGRSLPGWKGPVPGDVKLRLMKLWERRLGVIRHKPSAHQQELAAFGWWFATGLFEQRWAIEQLRSVIELTGGRVDSTHMVVAKLAEMAGGIPAAAVEILARIVEGDRGRTIVGWRDQGRSVLSAVLESSDERAREAAMELMDAFEVEEVPQDTTWESARSKPSSKRGAPDRTGA